MPREVIASLALRGARLTKRFRNDKQWDRYRWLRLRIALTGMQNLCKETSIALPAYIDILNDEDTFLASTALDYPYDPYTPYRLATPISRGTDPRPPNSGRPPARC